MVMTEIHLTIPRTDYIKFTKYAEQEGKTVKELTAELIEAYIDAKDEEPEE